MAPDDAVAGASPSGPLETDPGLAVEVRSWLELAALDLEAARRLAADPAFARIAVYHCQQSAEKAVKGFLTANGVRFGRTHDLDVLGSQALTVDPSLGPALDRVVELTPYAWLYRYPPDFPAPVAEETSGAIAAAGGLIDAIRGALPGDLRPG